MLADTSAAHVTADVARHGSCWCWSRHFPPFVYTSHQTKEEPAPAACLPRVLRTTRLHVTFAAARPPAGARRRRPMAAAPAAHAYRASASVTTRPLHSASALRSSVPPSLLPSLLYQRILVCLNRNSKACEEFVSEGARSSVKKKVPIGCSVHRGD